MKQKRASERNYDKELKELFNNTKRNVDPRIQKTIDLIEKINNQNNQLYYELTTSCTGTTA